MIAITDDTGAVAAKFAYTPFGEVIDSTINQPACDIPLGFAGQFGVLREPNGLYFMNTRYYDSKIGRFLSEDPAGLGGGDLTLYSYASNNPVVFVDPSGLCSQGIGGGFVNAVSSGLEHFGNNMMTTSDVLFGGAMASYAAAGITELATGGASTPFSVGAAGYGTFALSASGYATMVGAGSLALADVIKQDYLKAGLEIGLSYSGKPGEHMAEALGVGKALSGLSDWLLEEYNRSLVHQ